MLHDTKTAIVYSAGGTIGSAVARAYAREGADVHRGQAMKTRAQVSHQ